MPREDNIRLKLQTEMRRITEFRHKKLEEWLENLLRNEVSPPIKGKITKGKLNYRGLKIVEIEKTGEYMVRQYILHQRGVQIGMGLELNIEKGL
jgi:hypothetical protein